MIYSACLQISSRAETDALACFMPLVYVVARRYFLWIINEAAECTGSGKLAFFQKCKSNRSQSDHHYTSTRLDCYTYI